MNSCKICKRKCPIKTWATCSEYCQKVLRRRPRCATCQEKCEEKRRKFCSRNCYQNYLTNYGKPGSVTYNILCGLAWGMPVVEVSGILNTTPYQCQAARRKYKNTYKYLCQKYASDIPENETGIGRGT